MNLGQSSQTQTGLVYFKKLLTDVIEFRRRARLHVRNEREHQALGYRSDFEAKQLSRKAQCACETFSGVNMSLIHGVCLSN
jgi:hypothetical protein